MISLQMKRNYMLKYEIEGGHLPVLTCYPEAGQMLCTERGSMSWMSSDIEMQTKQAVVLRRRWADSLPVNPSF